MEPLLDSAAVARLLNSSEAFVRRHAAEMGGIRLGGSRSPFRFEEQLIREYLDRQRLTVPVPVPVEVAAPVARGRRARRTATGVELLPLPREAAA